jgi:SAM-dependent methyltransferase
MSEFISNEAAFIPANYRELLLGCGNDRRKKIRLKDHGAEWHNLTTLDMSAETNPDVVFDLDRLPAERLPFEDDTFDEVHAYEVLEHFGRQGDWRGFFGQFAEFWRILKPSGLFIATTPKWDSPWAWSDPGHTRIISRESLIFLSQAQYAQVGSNPMSDYRPWYKADFDVVAADDNDPDTFKFILMALK